MAHKHSIYDADSHFRIDPISRQILNMSSKKNTLIQGDHNSERFTFEIPRFVEGHDMSNCIPSQGGKVEVHFTNGETDDVYLVDDLQISPDADDVVIFSWLISGNATQHIGTLEFSIRFACLTDTTIDYEWNTTVYNSIRIGKRKHNSQVVVDRNSDILEEWGAKVGASLFIRYSAYPDGTNFTETWSVGQNYLGVATAVKCPTNKSEFTWVLIRGAQGEPGEPGESIKGEDGTSVTHRIEGNILTFTSASGTDTIDLTTFCAQGEKGDAFAIAKSYSTIEEMEADAANIPSGDFVLIASGEDGHPDNGKLFVKEESSFTYVITMTGLKGEDGEDGEDGYTPYISQGYWYINNTNTGVKALGEDGKTPYIQDNKWYIDSVDTGVTAVGKDGKNGKDGTNGSSAFEIACLTGKFEGTEAEWIDYLNGHTKQVMTTDGQFLRFFVGTQAQYESLADKNNVFAILTDDPMQAKITAMLEWFEKEHGADGTGGYVPISITSFKNSLSGKYELGTTVTDEVKLTWAFNKTPKALTLNGSTVSTTSTGKTIASNTYSETTSWTLKATGDNGETDTETVYLNFYPAVYYGTSSSTTYNQSLIKSLTKELSNSHKTSFNVNAGAGQYIYYCVPDDFRTPDFYFNELQFAGGITQVATGVNYTVGSTTLKYTIYRSDYPNLGSNKIRIS